MQVFLKFEPHIFVFVVDWQTTYFVRLFRLVFCLCSNIILLVLFSELGNSSLSVGDELATVYRAASVANAAVKIVKLVFIFGKQFVHFPLELYIVRRALLIVKGCSLYLIFVLLSHVF
jgi:hypothetical protein